MIDKRLFQLTEKKNLVKLVLVRLLQLGASIIMWLAIAQQLAQYAKQETIHTPARLVVILIGVLIVKIIASKWVENLTYQASSELRLTMRQAVLEKAFRLGKGQGQVAGTVLAQLSVDGIEQLEVYYARFLPQLFYCLFASLMVFGTLVQFALFPAVVLLICLPLIPLIIMNVMKIAKRILSGYWTQYTDLGAKFHENLSGLSTLKAYHQDEKKQREAVNEADKFRRVTMSLLSMQLNSITVMDIVSYCGAALGIGLALISYTQNEVSLVGMLLFLLLSAEFFIPMRQLGSLFHVAMNGISACKKLFSYLELPEQAYGQQKLTESVTKLALKHVNYQYETSGKNVLKDINLTVKQGQFTALVGASGSGKSTLAKLLLHQLSGYEGTIDWNDCSLAELTHETIQQKAVLVDNHGYLYPSSIKENLLIGRSTATDAELWAVLEKVQLANFVAHLPQQLVTVLAEDGQNLSGGQRQRLLLARALLKEADCYVFDEITSGIDLKSEEIILTCLQQLAQTHIVLFISHRLYNVLEADHVVIFEAGCIVGEGTPDSLQTESEYFKNYFRKEQQVIAGGVVK